MSGEATVIDRESGHVVCERCVVAANPWTRLRGLLGRSELSAGEGLLLRPAAAIHTWFMRFAIDAVFLDRSLTVLEVVPDLGRRRTARRRGARAVLELEAGESERRGLRPGDRLMVLEGRPSLMQRIDAMLTRDRETDAEPLTWLETERLLTEGYARALTLEGERLRIERDIGRLRDSLDELHEVAARLQASVEEAPGRAER